MTGPLAGAGLDLEKTLMLFDDAKDGGETETGPFPDGLGGEERFEDLGAGFGIHTDAGIADFKRVATVTRMTRSTEG